MNKNMYCISIHESEWHVDFQVCAPLCIWPYLVIPNVEWRSVLKFEVKHHLGWNGRFPGSLYSHAYQWSLGPFEIVRKVKGCKKSLLLHNSYDFTSIMRDAANLSCQYRTLTGLWVSCIFSKLLCDNWLENRLHFPWTICNICRCAFWALLFPKYTYVTCHEPQIYMYIRIYIYMSIFSVY